MLWDGIITAGLEIINKVIPDPAQKAEAQLKLLQLQQAGEFKQLEVDLQLAQGQVDINKIEAESDDLFKSGWRPMVGWTCALGFFAKYMGGPLLFVISQYFGHPIELPEIDTMELMPLLFGMLGLGAYRTYEKVKLK